ncbi:AzlD domain-containing protein [Paucilactobacillus suebicus]|nr:AzlD domain-containing protein [Paucilactobacillus suebicus]
MDSTDHLILIALAAVTAFLPRYIPMLFFSTREIPDWFNEWMKYVPVSLFTALVVKSVFLSSTYHIELLGHVNYIIAGVIVILITYVTRSMAFSVLAGLVAVFVITTFF